MATRTVEHFAALPPYLGESVASRRLIFALLGEVVEPATWPGLVLVDPFCGGGSVALYAKLQGFDVVAGDLAERACIVARALIANSSTS